MPNCLMVLAPLALSAAPPAPDDSDAIQGKWRLVSAAFGLRESPGRDIWTITKAHFVYESGRKAAYTLDAERGRIDVTAKRGLGEEEEKLVGIYELKGDTLEISITEADRPRPAKIEKGKDHNFFVRKRVKLGK